MHINLIASLKLNELYRDYMSTLAVSRYARRTFVCTTTDPAILPVKFSFWYGYVLDRSVG